MSDLIGVEETRNCPDSLIRSKACDSCTDQNRAYREHAQDQLKEYVRKLYIDDREAMIEHVRPYNFEMGKYYYEQLTCPLCESVVA